MFPSIDLHLAAPAIILGTTSLLVLLLSVAPGPQRSSGSGSHLAILSLLGLGAAAAHVAFGAWPQAPGGPLGLLGDGQARGFALLALMSVAGTLPAAQAYLAERRLPSGEFFALSLLATLGMLLVAQAADLIVMFLGLEIMSLAAYALAGYRRGRGGGQEAALKYFISGAFAAACMLFGIGLIYGDTGRSLAAPSFGLAHIAEHFAQVPSALGWAGVVMLLAGLLFKAAVVPFHMWAPDVYDGAPTPVTALLAGAMKVAAIAALARVLPACFGAGLGQVQAAAPQLLAAVAVVTMAGGNLLALRQNQLKRLLAYSSIAHAGYLLLGLLAMLYRPHGESLAWLGVYLMAYLGTTVGIFTVAIALEPADERSQPLSLQSLRGVGQARPALALAMTCFLLSLAGLPPSGGFMGKMGIFLAAIDAGQARWVALAALCSVLGAAAYLRVLFAVWTPSNRQRQAPTASRWLSCALLLALVVTVGSGLAPAVGLKQSLKLLGQIAQAPPPLFLPSRR